MRWRLFLLPAILAACEAAPKDGPVTPVAQDSRPTRSERLEKGRLEQASIRELIEALSDEDAARRNEAEARLAKGGDGVLVALRAALDSSDAEGRTRAERLLLRVDPAYLPVRSDRSRQTFALSPDGECLLYYSEIDRLVLLNLKTGLEVWSREHGKLGHRSSGAPALVLAPVFHQGGQELVAQMADDVLETLAASDGHVVRSLRLTNERLVTGGRLCVAAGQVFYAGVGSVGAFLEDRTGTWLGPLTIAARGPRGQSTLVGPDPRGRLVAFFGQYLGVYNPFSHKLLEQPRRLAEPLQFMAAPADASVLYFASREDGFLRMMRPGAARENESVWLSHEGATSLAVSADGRFLALGTAGNSVLVFQTDDFRPCADLAFDHEPEFLVFSSDGAVLGVRAGAENHLFKHRPRR